MNLFPYASALSFLLASLLSEAFILNLMQFSVQPLPKMMPCLLGFLFSDLVFHKSR